MADFRDSFRKQSARLSVVPVAGLLWALMPAAVQVQAQSSGKTMLMEPPAPLLPAALGKMQRVAEGDVGDGLGSLDSADAPVLKEDGLKRFARSDYADGARRDNVTVYQFIDTSGAIAAFDYFRKPGMRAEKLGDDAVSSADEVVIRSGKNVVLQRSKSDHAGLADATTELISRLPKALGSAALPPLVPTLLPAKGLDADSVRYALGPAGYAAMGGVLPAQAVGFEKSAEAVTAKYKGGGVLTVLLYPTPQIAGEYGRAIDAATKADAGAAVKQRREGTLLAIASGAWPGDSAEKVIGSVHLRSDVSFDKPMPLEFHAEVQKTFTLLQSIAIFSGLGALAAVVLGLFLGFGRAGIRILQGKPAATEAEFLRIDLRGSVGKRLRSPRV